MSHTIKMILGCLLPFLVIFLLPLVGAGEGTRLLVFTVLMFACHLFMMGGHGGHRGHGGRRDSPYSGQEKESR